MTEPEQMRVSDDDRHRVAEILREAAGEGRLDLEELDQRLEAAYAARTYADLVPLTHDLPVARSQGQVVPVSSTPPPVVVGPETERHVAIMSGLERKGAWVVPQHLKVFAMMGGADLDLREARFAAREVVISISCFMGGAQITVGPDTNVVMEGTGIMGGYSGPNDAMGVVDPSRPTVRVRGVAVWGGVSVVRKP